MNKDKQIEIYQRELTRWEIENYNLKLKINKALDYLKKHVVATETEDILISILEDKDESR